MKPPPESHLKVRDVTFALKLPLLGIRCSPALLPAAHAFQQNIRRNVALGELAARIAGWSSANQRAEDLATIEAELPLSPLAEVISASDNYPRVAPEYSETYRRVWERIGADPHFTTDYIKQLGLYRLNVLVASHAGHLDSGLEAIFQAMLLGAWTAFEALAGDLFDAALSHGPAEWRARSARAKRRHFQSLQEIRAAYRAVFGQDSQAVFDRYPRVVILKVVRNLLAHSGGKVNARFKSQVSQDATFASATVGSLLRLDGAITKDLFEAVASCGGDLLHMVDSKLADAILPQLSEQEAEILEQIRAAVRVPNGDENNAPK